MTAQINRVIMNLLVILRGDFMNFDQILIFTRKIREEMMKKCNYLIKHLNISCKHTSVLITLLDYESGCSMSVLSENLDVDNALMTRNIQELEYIGYVYRDRNDLKSRKYNICLTEKGKEIALEVKQITTHLLNNMSELFTETELIILKDAMNIVFQKYEEQNKKGNVSC